MPENARPDDPATQPPFSDQIIRHTSDMQSEPSDLRGTSSSAMHPDQAPASEDEPANMSFVSEHEAQDIAADQPRSRELSEWGDDNSPTQIIH